MDNTERNAKAAASANLDQLWADLRPDKANIETIAEVGLPEPDDEGAAAHQDLLVRRMACVVAAELGARELEGP